MSKSERLRGAGERALGRSAGAQSARKGKEACHVVRRSPVSSTCGENPVPELMSAYAVRKNDHQEFFAEGMKVRPARQYLL